MMCKPTDCSFRLMCYSLICWTRKIVAHFLKPRNFHAILAALASLMYSLTVQAQVEVSITKPSEVSHLEVANVISRDSYSKNSVGNYWTLGKWQLKKPYYLEARYGCSIPSKYGFWPTLGECDGEFQINVDPVQLIEFHEEKRRELRAEIEQNGDGKNIFVQLLNERMGDIRIDMLYKEQLAYQKRIQENDWSIPVKGYISTSKFFNSIKDDGLALNVGGVSYEVLQFESIANAGIELAMDSVNKRILDERREIILGMIIGVAGSIVSLFLSVKFIRYAKIKFAQGRARAEEQVEKLQAANQRRKARAVMMDETIREMTRTALSDTDNKSREVLIDELRKAIESGNHDLANALEIALKKA